MGGPLHETLPFFGLLLDTPISIQFFFPGLLVQYDTTSKRCTGSTLREPAQPVRTRPTACDRSTEILCVKMKLFKKSKRPVRPLSFKTRSACSLSCMKKRLPTVIVGAGLNSSRTSMRNHCSEASSTKDMTSNSSSLSMTKVARPECTRQF